MAPKMVTSPARSVTVAVAAGPDLIGSHSQYGASCGLVGVASTNLIGAYELFSKSHMPESRNMPQSRIEMMSLAATVKKYWRVVTYAFTFDSLD
jgi:hypothetical protein